jgi:WD40 repeat protein
LKNGSVNKGWTVAATKSEIHKKISYLKFNGGDYFATSDKDGNVLIVDKKGNDKIKLKTIFEAAANSSFYSVKEGKKLKPCILTADKDGELIFISSLGEIEKKNTGKYSPQHYFLYNDKSNKYIFLDKNKLSIFDENLKQIGSYSFPSDMDGIPVIYNEAGIKDFICAVSLKTQKVYLLKSTCKLKEGFPLTGTTLIVIGSLNNDGSLNLLVGSGSNLYNYSFQLL